MTDGVAKLIYGHQETCTAMMRSLCGKYLISLDTLNKVVVNNFPNMFNIHVVSTDQRTSINDVCLFKDKVATVGHEGKSELVVFDITSGKTT